MTDTQTSTVRFDRYGELDALHSTDIPMPKLVAEEVVGLLGTAEAAVLETGRDPPKMQA